MKIIVDMMGGDNAPLAVLEGTAQAVKEYGVQVIGVGSEELVRKTAAEHNIPLDGIELVNCTETIEMCDEPARAIRSKKDSSIVVGLNLLKEGKGEITGEEKFIRLLRPKCGVLHGRSITRLQARLKKPPRPKEKAKRRVLPQTMNRRKIRKR